MGRWASLRSRLVLRLSGSEMLAEETRARLNVRTGKERVTAESAMRNSAMWACIRLRANLISSMPVDTLRAVNGLSVEVPNSPVLKRPGALFAGGEPVTMREWLYATQSDLDRSGNTFGLITEKTALGLPARIDLVPLRDVVVRIRKSVLRYVIGGVVYDPSEVWHERQYPQAGLPVGLDPVAHAVLALGEYASAQELALDWFGGTAAPAAHLRNTQKTITGTEARKIKDLYRATVDDGDVLVTGSDWELKPFEAAEASRAYLEARRVGLVDIARFFDVPADLIDAAVAGSSLTYANITQRNLQFLVMSLGPAVARREEALSVLTPAPRTVKLNRRALLAMDPSATALAMRTEVEARLMTPDEGRRILDRPPLTDTDYAQFDRLFGARSTPPTATGVPA